MISYNRTVGLGEWNRSEDMEKAVKVRIKNEIKCKLMKNVLMQVYESLQHLQVRIDNVSYPLIQPTYFGVKYKMFSVKRRKHLKKK